MHAFKGKWIALSLLSGSAAILPGFAWPLETLAADSAAVSSPLHGWVAVDNARLEEMRGGFDIAPGLRVSFGIERVINLNGVLQTAIRIEVPDAGKLIESQQTPAIASTGAAGTTAAAVAPLIASATQAAPSTQASAEAASATQTTQGAAPTSTPAASAASVTTSLGNGGAVLIQNGPGNTFSPGLLTQATGATFIQNSINNQTIQSVTIINTTTNSMELLKGANLQSTLLDAITQAVGSR